MEAGGTAKNGGDSMETVEKVLTWMNGYLWGWPMLVLLLGTHLFLTIRLRFIQRHIVLGITLSAKKETSAAGDVSPFAALATALAATIGTGNIVGVATAIALGGPGAVLWMWLTGVFGISTKYAEALLAVKYRVRTSNGLMLGGPMYALERGLNLKWLAVLFCIFTTIAAFGIGNTVQANSIASLMNETLNVPVHVSGIVMTILTALVILGGIRSIALVCEFLVPFMAAFYIVGCVVVLAINVDFLMPAIALICKSAFSARAAGGGFAGATLMLAARYGIARGLFSNESGLGSAPIVAAAAQTRNPVRQALISATGTFWDTVIVCALTGLVLVSSIIKHPAGFDGLNGASLSRMAFAAIPMVGPLVLPVGLFTFVFSTILGWSYYGEKAVEYLFGKKSILPYRLAWVAAVYIGSVQSLSMVWSFADAVNALMAIPNLVSILLLSPVIVAETGKYLWSGRIDQAEQTSSNPEIPVAEEVFSA
jgi:AGCS family alanine or glycine:cation symporter